MFSWYTDVSLIQALVPSDVLIRQNSPKHYYLCAMHTDVVRSHVKHRHVINKLKFGLTGCSFGTFTDTKPQWQRMLIKISHQFGIIITIVISTPLL